MSNATEKTLAKERAEKSRVYLTKASELLPDDLDVLVDLAILQQRTEPSAALSTYNRILAHLQTAEIEMPAELQNNIGVLYYQLKNYEEARVCS